MKFHGYDPQNGPFFDELFEATDAPRPGCSRLVNGINGLPEGELLGRQAAAERALLSMGITFTLKGEGERIFPFDIIPRIITAKEWERLERGLKQRIEALNLFIADVYGEQKIIKDGIVPAELVRTCADYRPQCEGLKPPRGIWCHITGTDLVRDKNGEFYVLEDNLRCPSGVSYVLENRQVLKRTFPKIFESLRVRPVDDYPLKLLDTLRHLAPDAVSEPRVVVLTPGRYNSAYYEHAFLAQQMGVELVEPFDLVVRDGFLQMRTTAGLQRVDVVYRRVSDDYMDPLAFRPESLLGVPGIFDVYVKGRVALANAPGTGVADDKAIYRYVERIIKYYLDQDAIIPNVPTYVCTNPEDCSYVLSHLPELVVKATDGAGGYGMLVGPHSTAAEQADFAERIKKNPRGYIAQPTLSLSRVPTIVGDQIEGRHVDLRPYVLYGREIQVSPGGLTRVALKKGSLVVNSSHGGGSKDTGFWPRERHSQMLSRVADAIYWASRYVERAENVARFIDVSLNLMLESSGQAERDWASLVHTTGDQEFFQKKYGAATPANVTQFLTFDEEYSSSILSSVGRARENARSVRDIISREMWQELNEFYLMVVQAARPGVQPEDLIDFCARVKRAGIYFEGVTNATLSRGEAFHFANLGRMLERADKTSRILDVKYFLLSPSPAPAQKAQSQAQAQAQASVGSNVDLVGWTTLLNSASALQMYRQIWHVTTPEAVSEFLLLDRNFPRSILRCVRRAQESLHAVSGEPLGSFGSEGERLLGRLRSELDYAKISEIMEQGLHQYVDALQSQLNDVSGAIQNQFFDL